MLARILAVLAASVAALVPLDTRANLNVPGCDSLATWVQATDRAARWSPNGLGTRVSLPAALVAPEAERLFGKPLLAWTAEEVREAVAVFDTCRAEWQRGRRQDVMAAAQPLRNELVGAVARWLAGRSRAQTAIVDSSAALAAARPDLPLLAFLHGLAGAAASAEAFAEAARAASAAPAPAGIHARALIGALRDLTAGEIAAAIAPVAALAEARRPVVAAGLVEAIAREPATAQGVAAAERLAGQARGQRAALGETGLAEVEAAVTAKRGAVADATAEALARNIAGVPPGMPGVQALDRLAQGLGAREGELGPERIAALRRAALEKRGEIAAALLGQTLAEIARLPAHPAGFFLLDRLAAPPAGLFDAAQRGALTAAIAARRTTMQGEMAAAIAAEIAEVAPDETAFDALDRLTEPRLLGLLADTQRAELAAAATKRREEVGVRVLADLSRSLAALPVREDSLDVIDGRVVPGVRAWPASASVERTKAEAAAKARRDELVARLNRAEAGSLRGRAYAAEGTELEFVDRTRVFVKAMGQTIAGTYREESDGRVVVTVGPNAVVFSREGKRLVGAGEVYTRVK